MVWGDVHRLPCVFGGMASPPWWVLVVGMGGGMTEGEQKDCICGGWQGWAKEGLTGQSVFVPKMAWSQPFSSL